MADPKVGEIEELGEELAPQENLSNTPTQPIQDATNVKNLESELELLKKEIRGLQGRQDKSTSAFQEFLSEYKNQKKKGLGDEEAEIAATNVLDERKKAANQEILLQKIAQKLGLDEDSLGVAGNNTKRATGHDKVIEKFGLNANDPMITTLIRDNPDVLDFSIAVGKYNSGQKDAPNPTESQKAAVSSSRSSSKPDVSALTVELNTAMRSPNPSMKRIKEIEKQLIELGEWKE